MGKQRIKILGISIPSLALGIIIALMAVWMVNPVGCAQAATCPVGSTAVFTNNIGIQGTTAFTFTVTGTPTADRTFTIPMTASDTFVMLAATQTLTNKTLTSPTITGGTITAMTGFALRDTSAAFDVTIAATSAPVLSAGRTLTIDMGDVAHTIDLGATANTITFPSVASDTVVMLAATQTLTAKTLTSPIVGTQITLDQSTADYTLTWANPAAGRAISIADPGGTDVFTFNAATQELDNKTLDSSVGKGTWTTSGTWTLPAFTMGGSVTITSSSQVFINQGTFTLGGSTTPGLEGGIALMLRSNTIAGDGVTLQLLNGNTGAGAVNFGDSDDSNIGKLEYDHNTDAMNFRIADATRTTMSSTTITTTSSLVFSTAGATITNSATAGAIVYSGGFMIGANAAANQFDDASNGVGSTGMFIGNASINVTSDERIKEGLKLFTGDASFLLRSLPVKSWDRYTRDAPIGNYEGGYIGFTAQDILKIAPWAVNTQGDTDLPWTARYELLNGLIVKGWQEHDERISTLEQRIVDLEKRLQESQN